MSNGSDPNEILDALGRAQDAFDYRGRGRPTPEHGVESGGDWETQLTKACRLLEVIESIEEHNGHFTAIIELSFGAIERSIEAYAVAMSGDEVEEFRDHEFSYERAHQLGLFERETAEKMKNLYSENRTESYYGGGQPTDHQAEAMAELARSVHGFVVDQIREGGICICDAD